jgi:hypothetical protein
MALADVADAAEQDRAAAAEDQDGHRGAARDRDRDRDHAADEAEDVGNAGITVTDDEQHGVSFRNLM